MDGLERTGHFWGAGDYATVLALMRRLRPDTVLEFGPGRSTLALMDGGAKRIDSCEDCDSWLQLWHGRLAGHASAIRFVKYTWADPLLIPDIDGNRYDLALIDGPFAVERRAAVIAYCLGRCNAVVVPLELTHGDDLKRVVICTAEELGLCIELIDSGELAGQFALLTR